jgi:hypothetical protein
MDDNTRMDFIRIKGQVYFTVQIVCEGSTDTDDIEFIYDTGAFLTVINREVYEWYRLDKLPRKEGAVGGYNGCTPGYVFQIPGLVIGKRLLSGVWAFSPKNNELKQNLLGDNIIEYFRPFQDNMNDCFYFMDNLTPEPYIYPNTNFSFACESVMPLCDKNLC